MPYTRAVTCLTLLLAEMPALALSDVKPEYGGLDAMALGDRQRVATDCKIDWTSKRGKRYCFSSDQAKTDFLRNQDENIVKATDMFAAGDIENVGKAMEAFTSSDASTFVKDKIETAAKANGGTYLLNDSVTNSSIPLARM